jgi:hypothetical protein
MFRTQSPGNSPRVDDSVSKKQQGHQRTKTWGNNLDYPQTIQLQTTVLYGGSVPGATHKRAEPLVRSFIPPASPFARAVIMGDEISRNDKKDRHAAAPQQRPVSNLTVLLQQQDQQQQTPPPQTTNNTVSPKREADSSSGPPPLETPLTINALGSSAPSQLFVRQSSHSANHATSGLLPYPKILSRQLSANAMPPISTTGLSFPSQHRSTDRKVRRYVTSTSESWSHLFVCYFY